MATPLQQTDAPLLQTLQNAADRDRAAFHTPGHKQGKGTPAHLRDWWGGAVFRADLPELPELDNLFSPGGVIQQAQALAAEAFGAEQTWFLANGSTCGIEAAVLATCNPGDKLILPRNAHQSAIAALILSGATPIFLEPEYNAAWELPLNVTPKTVAAALTAHPDAKAVLLVSPTYHGVCSDVATIAQITHTSGIPLLMDEAHGAHFAFHPDLPISALAAGSDLTVQSIHKTLAAMTQAAMLHIRSSRIDRDRLNQSLQLVQSTSPNYLLLASLDAARQQMATQGHELMNQTLELAKRAQTELNPIPGLSVLMPDANSLTANSLTLDPTRITVDVRGLGLTGFEVDETLHQTFGVTAELPSLHHLTFIVTLGNTPEDIDRLVQACKTIAAQHPIPLTSPHPPIPPSPHPSISPRQAFFSPTITLPIDQAINRISAELVCPYPPGIPVLFPGEVVTDAAVDYLKQVLASGGVITGCADPELLSLRVVD